MWNREFSEWLEAGKFTADNAVSELKIKKGLKKHEIVFKRYWFWHFMKQKFFITVSDCGRLTGHDHSTVLHGLKFTKEDLPWLRQDKELVRETVERIEDSRWRKK